MLSHFIALQRQQSFYVAVEPRECQTTGLLGRKGELFFSLSEAEQEDKAATLASEHQWPSSLM